MHSVTEDAFRRRVSYLRISLTDRCNLKCRYCMPRGGIQFFQGQDLMTPGELRRLLHIFVGLGVDKVRLTGGEPTLRRDLEEIVRMVRTFGNIRDVSLTTNGIFLAGRARSLLEAGLTRINVSLDSLRRDRFQKITGFDGVDRVLKGIWESVEAGLDPVKINMVVMRGVNFDEILDFVSLAQRSPLQVRFIELMPTRNNENDTAEVGPEHFVGWEEIRSGVARAALLGSEEPPKGVARVFPVLGGLGRVGFISPVSNHFCGSCNRLRLTAKGELKTCLHGEDRVDLLTPLRQGASNEKIEEMIRGAVWIKPPEHFIRPDRFVSSFLQMSQVGG